MAVHRSVTGAWKRTVFVLVVLLLLAAPASVFARQYKTTSRISISSTGVQGINIQHPVINGDGRYVAFWSDKEGLVVGDTNFVGDVFVRDTQTNTTTRVSLGFGGVQTARTGGLPTSYPDIDISDSGCIVVYASDATNIRNVPDTNETADVFAVDRCAGGFPTVQVSVQDNTGATGIQANQGGTNPRVSGNGQFVLFRSASTDILFDSNGPVPDIYIYDRASFRTSRVNVSSGGAQANIEDGSSGYGLSDDGFIVAFASVATNLVGGDTNGRSDIFIRDRPNNTTVRIMGLGGAQPNGNSFNPTVTGNGRYIAFRSDASNLVAGDTNNRSDIFVYDRNTGDMERVSISSEGAQANASSDRPFMTDNGRFVSFYSDASNLVDGDTNGAGDIFVHDRTTGITTLASVTSGGTLANGPAGQYSALSDDGAFFAFESNASNIVPGDTNGTSDVFHSVAGPISPNNLSLVNKTTDAVTMSWDDNSSGEDNFVIERRRLRDDGTLTSWSIVQTLGPNSELFTNSSLGACRTYDFRVFSVDNGIRSSSNILRVKTLGCPPGPFSLMDPINNEVVINRARVDFRWTPSEEAEDFDITVTNTGSLAVVHTETLDAATICDANRCLYAPPPAVYNLLTNGSYSFTVQARNIYDQGVPTQASNNPGLFSVDDTLPPRDFDLYTPAQDTFLRNLNGWAGFTWRDNKDAGTYNLVVIEISNNNTRLGTVINQIGLTPATDGDGLTCNFETRICTYEPTVGELAALSEGTFAWTVFAVSPGGNPRESSMGAITFRINTGDIEMLVNGGFEEKDPVTGAAIGWTVENSTGDTVKCNKPGKTFTNFGECAFRFKGGVGESSKLVQLVYDSLWNMTTGDVIQLEGILNAAALTEGDIVVQLKVAYVDGGLPKDKAKYKPPTGVYVDQAMAPLSIVIDGAVAEITVQIKHKADSGKIYLDELELLLLAPGGPRGDGVRYLPNTRIPVTGDSPDGLLLPPPPPAVDGFRGQN
ncbi:MAG: hypothetical protein IPM16_07660 [Chloroflexi bacterium]|nr:hypothetical protein [Chloroflexota bacterium]